jgi:hypothetical protein
MLTSEWGCMGATTQPQNRGSVISLEGGCLARGGAQLILMHGHAKQPSTHAFRVTHSFCALTPSAPPPHFFKAFALSALSVLRVSPCVCVRPVPCVPAGCLLQRRLQSSSTCPPCRTQAQASLRPHQQATWPLMWMAWRLRRQVCWCLVSWAVPCLGVPPLLAVWWKHVKPYSAIMRAAGQQTAIVPVEPSQRVCCHMAVAGAPSPSQPCFPLLSVLAWVLPLQVLLLLVLLTRRMRMPWMTRTQHLTTQQQWQQQRAAAGGSLRGRMQGCTMSWGSSTPRRPKQVCVCVC